MDISKIKDVTKKLNVFKDYSSLLLPLGISMVAGLLFIPIQLLSSRLESQIANESISVGQKIDSLSASAVSRDQWKQEEEYERSYEKDANQISFLTKQSAQRELLSYKIFPQPKKDVSALVFSEFGQRFREKISELLVRVNARDCPTPAELERSLQSSVASRTYQSEGAVVPSQDTMVGRVMRDALCRARAEAASVYINPEDLSGYGTWGEYKYTGIADATNDCWYGQLAYWIVEDVISTIDVMNTGSNSVFTSPVKHLLSVTFTTDSGESKTTSLADSRPSYIITVQEGLTEPLTARVCNSDIDVVHFNVAVIVNTKAILPFMQQICSAKQHKFRGFSGDEQEMTFKHNQITVLESTISQVDREDPSYSLYQYGEDAVVRLDLICEYIFYKKGYKEIKPAAVKELLKEQQPGE